MLVGADKIGLGITVSGDRRITAVGRFLRHHKVDELPQLWNVLCGDMSLVGPRPEVPAYVAAYTLEQRRVLSVRPGITDLATIAYRYEEQILADHDDPERFYRTQVLPDKLVRNLVYLERVSLGGDLRIIFETVVSLFFPWSKPQVQSHSTPTTGPESQANETSKV
jgi:lipopolysaccharide/colanic/teichoic acid biosynthesis glycosyltransferase